jgi:hypothetical protein
MPSIMLGYHPPPSDTRLLISLPIVAPTVELRIREERIRID